MKTLTSLIRLFSLTLVMSMVFFDIAWAYLPGAFSERSSTLATQSRFKAFDTSEGRVFMNEAALTLAAANARRAGADDDAARGWNRWVNLAPSESLRLALSETRLIDTARVDTATGTAAFAVGDKMIGVKYASPYRAGWPVDINPIWDGPQPEVTFMDMGDISGEALAYRNSISGDGKGEESNFFGPQDRGTFLQRAALLLGLGLAAAVIPGCAGTSTEENLPPTTVARVDYQINRSHYTATVSRGGDNYFAVGVGSVLYTFDARNGEIKASYPQSGITPFVVKPEGGSLYVLYADELKDTFEYLKNVATDPQTRKALTDFQEAFNRAIAPHLTYAGRIHEETVEVPRQYYGNMTASKNSLYYIVLTGAGEQNLIYAFERSTGMVTYNPLDIKAGSGPSSTLPSAQQYSDSLMPMRRIMDLMFYETSDKAALIRLRDGLASEWRLFWPRSDNYAEADAGKVHFMAFSSPSAFEVRTYDTDGKMEGYELRRGQYNGSLFHSVYINGRTVSIDVFRPRDPQYASTLAGMKGALEDLLRRVPSGIDSNNLQTIYDAFVRESQEFLQTMTIGASIRSRDSISGTKQAEGVKQAEDIFIELVFDFIRSAKARNVNGQVIIGFCTDWVPDASRSMDEVRDLIYAVSQLGDNGDGTGIPGLVMVPAKKGENLAAAVEAKARELGVPHENIAILTSLERFNAERAALEALATPRKNDAGAFIAQVDPSGLKAFLNGRTVDVPLVEMLAKTLAGALNRPVTSDYAVLVITTENRRIVILVPLARPYDNDRERVDRYMARMKCLAAA